MDKAAILILGGYGSAGSMIARLLLAKTAVKHVIIAGRRAQKAQERRKSLAAEFAQERVSSLGVDAGDEAGLRQALARADLVIVCLAYRDNQADIMLRAVLDSGTHYIDLTPDTQKQQLFTSRADELAARRCIVLTEAGIIPGCPAVLTRLAAGEFDRVTTVTLASLYRDRDMAMDGARDLITHARQQPAALYAQGRWRQTSLRALRRIDFGARFGRQLATPVCLDELRLLPERYQIESLSLYQGSLNPIADGVLLLWRLLAFLPANQMVDPIARLLAWSIRRFTQPPFGIMQRVTAQGMKNGRAQQVTITLAQADMYLATAIPVVAAARQILDGMITEPGPQFMGHAVQPQPFIAEMERLGIRVKVKHA